MMCNIVEFLIVMHFKVHLNSPLVSIYLGRSDISWATCCLMCCSSACKLTLAVNLSAVNVWWLIEQAKVQDKTCVHVFKLDKKENADVL